LFEIYRTKGSFSTEIETIAHVIVLLAETNANSDDGPVETIPSSGIAFLDAIEN
jgi:hypothetical protein